MRRPRYPAAMSMVVGLVLVACAAPGGEPGASNGSEPSTAASAAGGDGGGGGGGGETSLPDGNWTGGHASASISGDHTATVEADLLGATSITDSGNTFLQYLAADGSQQIAVAIYPDPYSVAASVITAEISGGGSTDGGQCEASFSRTDGNALEGEIHCDGAPAVTASGTGGSIDIDLTFTATR